MRGSHSKQIIFYWLFFSCLVNFGAALILNLITYNWQDPSASNWEVHNVNLTKFSRHVLCKKIFFYRSKCIIHWARKTGLKHVKSWTYFTVGCFYFTAFFFPNILFTFYSFLIIFIPLWISYLKGALFFMDIFHIVGDY